MNPVRIRIAVSLFILILFFLLFCGPEKVSVFLSSILPPFQFVPALIRTVTNPAVAFIAGLVLMILLTLIFGRIYCSFLCPLGALQDIFIALSGKISRRKKHSFQKPQNLLRYSVLVIVVMTALTGSMVLVNLLDPYSITGRTLIQFAVPFFTGIYNTASSFMKHFNIYFFSRDAMPLLFAALLLNAGFFLMILFLSFGYGRLYCNTLCPVGTLLGLISRVSFFRFEIDKTECSGCAACAMVCKAGCIDTENNSIDNSRCVSCFNCLDACPQSVIRYRLPVKSHKPSWSPSRRSVLIGSLAAAGSALLVLNSGLRHLLRTAQVSGVTPVTPPGSVSLSHFTQACSACHLCVSACPTKVITPSLLAYGAAGLMQPKMNYPKSFCDYECNLCGRICPTGAILPLSPEEKKMTQIGTVDLLKERCVVYVDHTNCGACVEVCPTQTITFLNKENILYPVVDNRYCIGCGACSKACPTAPKSIIVRPNSVHKKALKYASAETSGGHKNATPNDFPF